jgi:hypothetical protein
MKAFFLSLMIAAGLCSFSQLKKYPGVPPPPDDLEEDNRNCVHRKKLSASQRLKLFPFNKARKIQLVSFQETDSNTIEGELPVKNGFVDYSLLKEVVTLIPSQVDSLTELLFNYGYKGVFYVDIQNLCYQPRNAIVFVDNHNRGFAFIELCFECENYQTSSKGIKTGDFCVQKYTLLKDFFLKQGIFYGTTVEEEKLD